MVSAWKDNRVVRVISTASDATSVTSVQRTVKSIEDYNRWCRQRGSAQRVLQMPYKIPQVHLLLPKGYLHLHTNSYDSIHPPTLIPSRVGSKQTKTPLKSLGIAHFPLHHQLPSVLSEKQKEGHSMVLPTVREVVLPPLTVLCHSIRTCN